ncbi:MAG: PKD domain-containing protein [Vicingaceae bacterium]|nr:PKD domain-containing protein [Vicingaceae bacterium]
MKISRILFLSIFAFLLTINDLYSATIVVGTGTATNATGSYPAPYGNFFWGAKHQFLITAAELNTAGMTAGNINNMAFVVDQANGIPLTGFTISMKNTLTTNLVAFETGLTTVLNPLTYTENAGLNTHVFSSPFYWDGVSNLLIETCFNNTSWTANATTFLTTTSHNSSVFYRQDASGVCGSNFTTGFVNERPNMIFDWNSAAVPPVSSFMANTTSTCSGVVNFTDLSTNNPTSWSWNFGDGSPLLTNQNPSHTYIASGNYTVTLIACNAFGCDTTIFTNYINVNLSAPTPVASSCTPNTLTYCCGFGMTNVTFNSINNNSGDGVDGYSDFTCFQTTVLEGQSYTLSIQTSAASTQNYAAWIDFNNDGVLNDVTERVFTASSLNNTSGNINIPAGAVLGTPLRMRVSSDYDFSAAPTPCADLDFGQAEDYTIIIIANPNPPTPIFSASPTTSCSGTVCFTDLSLNAPTGWLWDFGDGNTSFQQSPCHTYAADGVYTIKLTATNANGGNIDSIVNYVTINTAGQLLAASCSPVTSAYCCDYGVYQVDFNTISNPSLDGVEGYQDYSCTYSTTVTEGTIHSITIKTGINNAQDTRVWIDFNNDGSFNNTNELVMDAPNSYNPSVNYLIPSGAVLNTALRMRVSSDVVGPAQNACDANDFGQTEDYGLIIEPNTLPPNGNFIASITSTCSDTICFTDLSSSLPTGWIWYFGDGDTSTLQNPCHFYSAPGNYTVSLVTTNAFGQDSAVKFNYINVNCTNLTMPTSAPAINVTACSGTLFDDGGSFNNYSNNTDGVFTIQPTGATQVDINFVSFDFTTNQGDTLLVYDGPNTSSPLLGAFQGNFLPPPLSSSGGSITIRQVSNNFATDPGFELNWTCTTTGINDLLDNSEEFTVYPNPASDIVNIRAENSSVINEIIIFNTMGQIVLSDNSLNRSSQVQIDVSRLKDGLYFLNIKSEKGVTTKKINIK